MPLANTPDRFGAVSKTFHWLTALLIVALLPLGVIANDMPYETSAQLADKARLFSIHKTLGVAVFFVALARIAWALTQPKPGQLHPDRPLENLAAETVHWLLYGSLVVVPLSGWVHHAATSGFAPIWWPFGQNLPLVPKSEAVAALFGGAHWVLTKVLALAVVLHIAGALKHHVMDRDATLRRMWFGTGDVAVSGGAHAHIKPAGLALSLWAVALSVGAALGAYAPQERPGAAALADVQSDWVVQDGAIKLTVTQLGADVTGTFQDWTAAISFDETVEVGPVGRVAVTIAVGSLSLGSVTEQAMGSDFFDADTFPTATFDADLVRVVDGYAAQGTLTIKERSVPLTLPFGLSLNDDMAEMVAGLTLDRRTFGIGDNMTDESTLKFGVEVDVSLTALRAAPD